MKISLPALAVSVFALGALYTTGVPSAQACSVMEGWPPPAAELAAQTALVFAGSVESIFQDKTIYGNYHITFAVEESLTGTVGETVTLRAPGSSAACGYDDGYERFPVGSAWIMYASDEESGYATTAVTGNTRYNSVQEAVTALRAIKVEMEERLQVVPQQDLWAGKWGTSVTWLQKKLIAENTGPDARALAAVGATGYFGSYTQAALSEYQRAHAVVPAQGYFGPKTRAAFIANLSGPIAVPEDGPITLEGVTTCLPPKNTEGPVIALCALGLKTHEGTFYALNYEDTQDAGLVEGRVRVEGMFERREDSTWKQVGVVTVKKIEARN